MRRASAIRSFLPLSFERHISGTSLRGDRHGDGTALSGMLAAAGAPLNAELFVDSASPAGLPTVQQGSLAALEDDDVHEVPTQRRRWALPIVVLLVLAAASLAWVTLVM